MHGGGMTWGSHHLRSRTEPDLLRHRQSAARDRGQGPHGRQPVHRVHRRAESRHRQDGVVLPAVAARHARLGRRSQTPVLIDGEINGQKRKLVAQASRNGYFFVLDRTNGKNIVTTKFAKANWAKGVDAKGQPIPDPAKEPQTRRRAGGSESGRRRQLAAPELQSRYGPVLRECHRRLQRLLHLR